MGLKDIYDFYVRDAYVELYKFTCGQTAYGYAAVDTGEGYIRHDNAIFKPEYLTRTAIHFSSDYARDTLTVTMPANAAVPALFAGGTPEHELRLTIYRGGAHVRDFVVIWQGVVMGASFNYAADAYTCELQCETLASRQERRGLPRQYQLTCPHALYDAHCGVSRAAFARTMTVQSIAGFTLTLADVFPAGYYNAGQAVKADGSRRFITTSGTSTVTLERGFDVAIGEVLALYPGCDKSRQTCATKFGNQLNFGGFPWIPSQDPFRTQIG